MNEDRAFADYLGSELNKRNMTIRKMAELTGCHEKTMSEYVNGRRIPKPERTIKIARILKVNKKELLKLAIIQNGGRDRLLMLNFDKKTSSFADMMRYTRLLKGWTYEKMEEQTGIQYSAIVRYEGGYCLPDKSKTKRCIDFIGLPKEIVGAAITRDSKKINRKAIEAGTNVKYLTTYRKVTTDDYKKINTSKMSFSEFIRHRQTELGVSCEDLIEITGIPSTTIHNWVSNDIVANPVRLIYIADVLKINIYDLLKMYLKSYKVKGIYTNSLVLFRFCVGTVLGLSGVGIADYIGISHTTLYRIEHGIRYGSKNSLSLMCSTFDMTLDRLLKLRDSHYDYKSIESDIKASAKFMLTNYTAIWSQVPDSVRKQILGG